MKFSKFLKKKSKKILDSEKIMVSKSKEKKVENTDIEIRPKPIQGKGVSHFKMPRWPSGSPQINLFTTIAYGP